MTPCNACKLLLKIIMQLSAKVAFCLKNLEDFYFSQISKINKKMILYKLKKHYGYNCNYERELAWVFLICKMLQTYMIICSAPKPYFLNL